MYKILMISGSNTCRSPIAQAAMNLAIKDGGFENEFVVHCASVDARIPQVTPEPRVFSILSARGIDYTWHPRKVSSEDFQEYDYMFAMDEKNHIELNQMSAGIRNRKAQILLLGDFGLDPADRILMDPFHIVGEVYFDKIFRQSYPASAAFLAYTLLDHEYEHHYTRDCSE